MVVRARQFETRRGEEGTEWDTGSNGLPFDRHQPVLQKQTPARLGSCRQQHAITLVCKLAATGLLCPINLALLL
jgi:hypothetical protein